jgi:hypothetical protein
MVALLIYTAASRAMPLQPFAIIMNLAVGGAWPEALAAIDAAAFAGDARHAVKVDYVSAQMRAKACARTHPALSCVSKYALHTLTPHENTINTCRSDSCGAEGCSW